MGKAHVALLHQLISPCQPDYNESLLGGSNKWRKIMLAKNNALSLLVETFTHIKRASGSIFIISILLCSSLRNNIATPPDPLVVCRREVCLKADSQRNPSTRGCPIFGFWCVSTKKSISATFNISSRRQGYVQSASLQFHKVILSVFSVTWATRRQLVVRSFMIPRPSR